VPAVLCGTATLLTGVLIAAVSWPARSAVWWQEIPPRLMGVMVVLAGVAAWRWLPSPRMGQLVVFGGAVYFLQFLRGTAGALFAAGFCLAYAWTAAAAHIMLAWPSGRLHRRVDWVFVACAYAVAIATQGIRYFVDHPPPVQKFYIPLPGSVMTSLGSAAGAVIGATGIALVMHRWVTSTPIRRRPARPPSPSCATAPQVTSACTCDADPDRLTGQCNTAPA
jgi:hypothetical protein